VSPALPANWSVQTRAKYLAWETYVERGKHLPEWPAILRDAKGHRIKIPKSWHALYGKRHRPAVPSAARVPTRLKGPGVYVAEGSRGDLFTHGRELGWFAAIPYYWTDAEIRRLDDFPNLVRALWLPWWGWRGWDQPGVDGNGQRQEGVKQQLERFRATVYVGEIEFGSDPDPVRDGFWERAQPETFALLRPLQAAGVEAWLISDHCEEIAKRAGGKIPVGWNLQSECYADWIEHAVPGTGVHFRAPEQLALCQSVTVPGTAWLPVEGYFAPDDPPERARTRAHAWYLDDRAKVRPLAWGGWRGDGTMTPADFANLTEPVP
jgi:hypothetical protein